MKFRPFSEKRHVTLKANLIRQVQQNVAIPHFRNLVHRMWTRSTFKRALIVTFSMLNLCDIKLVNDLRSLASIVNK